MKKIVTFAFLAYFLGKKESIPIGGSGSVSLAVVLALVLPRWAEKEETGGPL